MKLILKQHFRIWGFLLCLFLLGGLMVSLFSGCTVVRTAPEIRPAMDDGRVNTYFLKQKFWSLADRFVIRDSMRQPVFHVEGKPFSFGDRLRFFDADGVERLYIRQKLFSLRHLFRIYKDSRLYAKMTKRIRVFQDKYLVDVPGPHDYIIQGNITNYHYRIFRNGRRVAEIAKRWPAWTDQYRVSIREGEDDLLLLAAAVVVDMVSHRNDHHPVVMHHH